MSKKNLITLPDDDMDNIVTIVGQGSTLLVDKASKTRHGIVKIGDGISVDDGVISADVTNDVLDNEIDGLKNYSDGNLAIAKEYADDRLVDAENHSDDNLAIAKGYSDSKLIEAKSYSDSNLATAKDYSDTKLVEAKSYSDSGLDTHNTSNVAHQYIRELIEALEQEIARLDGKGKSYGAIDKTQSELLALENKDAYILSFLENKYSGYTNAIGNLIYTQTVAGENEHEWEFNGTTWVDNGAWLIEKASNTEFGIVKGDNEYTSIVSGIIQVLKSDYATKVGSSVAYLDYVGLKEAVDELLNIYRKNETYSAVEIEQRITDLLGLANLQDTAIEYESGNYNFPQGASFDSNFLADFNWVFLRFITSNNEVRYNVFKPSEAVSGNFMTVIMQKSPSRYARIMKDNGNIHFDIVNEEHNIKTDLGCTMKMWGIKLKGINADEVVFEDTDVGNELERLRDVGEFVIIRDNYGNALKVVSPYGETVVIRDFNGSIVQINERLGDVQYKTTFIKDYQNKIVKVKKEVI